MSDAGHSTPPTPENTNSDRPDRHGFTPTELAAHALLRQALRRLRRTHALLLRVRRRLPAPPPAELERMLRHEIPFTVTARLRVDITDAAEFSLAETITICHITRPP